MNSLKKTLDIIKPNVEKYLSSCVSLVKYLTEHPEISGQEENSCNYIASFLRNNHYVVTTSLMNVPHSFKAVRKDAVHSKKPKVALLCEYDALPDIGHGCGHSCSAGISILSALALTDAFTDFPFDIEIIGTPDEEIGGGKESLASQGVFKDYEFAIMAHLFGHNEPNFRVLACSDLLVTFKGKSSHASAAPHEGRNALNGLQLFYHATDMLRQHLTNDVQIHGIIKEGGVLPSIVPDKAVAHFYPRAKSLETLYKVMKKMENCAKGAAIATETTYETKSIYKTYPEAFSGQMAIKTVSDVFDALGFEWQPADKPVGATDVGFIDKFIPVFQPLIKIDNNKVDEVELHTRELAELLLTGEGIKTLRNGATVLAGIIADLAEHPRKLETIKIQHKEYWECSKS